MSAVWRTAARALRAAGNTPGPSTSNAHPAMKRSVRGMAGACSSVSVHVSRDHGHGHGVTHEGLTLHPAAGWHSTLATGLTGLMWFWVFVRWSKDGNTLLFGHAPHFEHEDHHDEHAANPLLYNPKAKH